MNRNFFIRALAAALWTALLTIGLLPSARPLHAAEPAATSTAGALTSGILLDDFDPAVPAHDDLYLHVNGKWLEATEIPADQSNYGAFTILQENAQKALRELVEQMAEGDQAKSPSEQQLSAFYQSFMNTERLEELGLQPLEPYLQRIGEVESKEQLIALMAENDRLGVGNPFALYINADARDSNRYAVYVTQSGLSMPDRDYYLEDNERYQAIRAAFRKYVADLLAAAGRTDTQAAAESILELETKMAQAHWTRVENRDPIKTYNKLTAEQIAQLMPEFAWQKFADGVEVGQQPAFIVRQPSYLEAFNRMFAEVPLDVWKEYFTYRLIDSYATALSSKFDQLHFDFYQKTLSGVAEPKPRWRRGIDLLDSVLGELLGQIYVREYFKPEAKARMEQLVENLKKAFEQRIRELDWMSPATKHQALEKLSKIDTKIGYPDKWKDYSKLEVKPDELVQNLIRTAAFEHQRAVDKLDGPVDRSEWHMTPQTVNAYYNPLGNEIVFPAAILQPPFFNLEADDAVNYGGIGAVIGHELSHAFDDKGSRFDGDGNLRNWWSEEDRAAFDARGQQLVKQYAGYAPIDGIHLNGELTLGENIGDLGGVNMAYTAYRLSLGGQPAPVLDGLTGDQRFFLGYAQIWRRKYRDEELRRRLLTDPHSPSQYRVIGIVSNIDAFYDAFGIKPEHKMYLAPEQRVRIW